MKVTIRAENESKQMYVRDDNNSKDLDSCLFYGDFENSTLNPEGLKYLLERLGVEVVLINED